jgi:succinate dehydrogenase/fumarate reductase flavoprotein subunit
MAVEAGAALVDVEFMQFYPLAVSKEGTPTLKPVCSWTHSRSAMDATGVSVLSLSLECRLTTIGS